MRGFGRFATACVATAVALACPTYASQDIPEIRNAARAAAQADWALLGLDDRAKVRFPVRHESEDATLDDGAPARVFTASRGGVLYGVIVAHSTEPYGPAGEVSLGWALESYASKISGELVLARPIVLRGYRGREFEIVSSAGLMRGRIFLAGDRVYMVHVSFAGNVAPGEYAEIDRFLRSLEIVGTRAQRGRRR